MATNLPTNVPTNPMTQFDTVATQIHQTFDPYRWIWVVAP